MHQNSEVVICNRAILIDVGCTGLYICWSNQTSKNLVQRNGIHQINRTIAGDISGEIAGSGCVANWCCYSINRNNRTIFHILVIVNNCYIVVLDDIIFQIRESGEGMFFAIVIHIDN